MENEVVLSFDYSEKTFRYCSELGADLEPHPIMYGHDVSFDDYNTFKLDLVNGIVYLSKQQFRHASPIDLFAFIFFHLSRYEEYMPTVRDSHGRFRAEDSVLKDSLSIPIVDYALLWFKSYMLQNYEVDLRLKTSKSMDLTMDIDHAWKYANKGIFRTIGGLIKRIGNTRSIRSEYLESVLHPDQDPYSLRKWFDIFESCHFTFFVLLSSKRPWDNGIPISNTQFISAVRQLLSFGEVGIHPEYNCLSEQDYSELRKRFTSVFKQPPKISRQHFLRMTLPQTYRNLLTIGIKDDYSLGYAEALGFRAGSARSFWWFDLENNRTTTLRLHPFQLMDMTLKKYLRLSGEEALIVARKMRVEAEKVGGTFRVIWHNSSPPWESSWCEYTLLTQYLFNKKSEPSD